MVPLTIDQDDEGDAQPPAPGPVALRAHATATPEQAGPAPEAPAGPAPPAGTPDQPAAGQAGTAEATTAGQAGTAEATTAGQAGTAEVATAGQAGTAGVAAIEAAGRVPGRVVRRLGGAARVAVPPLLALVLAHAVLGLAVARAGGRPAAPILGPGPGGSTPYLAIAGDGYTLAPCPGRPHAWCGNTAWFPLYPALVNALAQTGIGLRWAAVAVSETATLLALALVWLLAGVRAPAAGVLALALAALFPGMVADHAALPFSLAAAAMLACVLALGRGRLAEAGTAGAVAAASHPAGLLLVPVLLVWPPLARGGGRLRRRLLHGALAALLAAAGFGVVALAWQRQVGAWDAWLKVHAGQLRLHDPAATLWQDLTAGAPAARLQALAVTAIALLGVGVTLRRPFVPAERALAATAALLWLATLAAAPRAPTHAAALLLPAAALTRQLPRPLQLLLVAAATALVAATVPPFLRGTLP